MIAVAVTDTIKVTANVITTADTLNCGSDPQFSDLLLFSPSLPDPEIYTYTYVSICICKEKPKDPYTSKLAMYCQEYITFCM